MTAFDLWTALESSRVYSRERRSTTRYPLQLSISVVAVDRKTVDGVGCTCNVSSKGVLFHSPIECYVGQQVEYIIDLFADSSVCLRCKGRVVRSEEPEPEAPARARRLLAATLEVYEYIRRAQ